jgi:hypothetical protein
MTVATDYADQLRKSYLHDLETGRKPPTTEVARRLDDALASGGRLAAAVRPPADGMLRRVRVSGKR